MINKNVRTLFIVLFFLGIFACSSKPVIMTHKDVKIGRDAASINCHDLGLVHGTTLTITGSVEEAVEDLKKEAARKGANYIKMEQTAGNSKDVTGIAYDCP